jgi:CRP-like cAMP-binding protein
VTDARPRALSRRTANRLRQTLQVVLPSRQDMAEITALTLETVSRMVSQLRQAGMLAPQRFGRHRSHRRFSVRSPADEAC